MYLSTDHKVSAKRSFAVTSNYEEKSRDNVKKGNNCNNEEVKFNTFKKPGVVFVVSRGMFLYLIVGVSKMQV